MDESTPADTEIEWMETPASPASEPTESADLPDQSSQLPGLEFGAPEEPSIASEEDPGDRGYEEPAKKSWNPKVGKGKPFPKAKWPKCVHGYAGPICGTPESGGISSLIRSHATTAQINGYLAELGKPAVLQPYISKYALKCLGQPPRVSGKHGPLAASVKDTAKAPKHSTSERLARGFYSENVDLASEPVPTPLDIKNNALKLFSYWMKHDQAKVTPALLSSVLTAAFKAEAKAEEDELKRNPKGSDATDLTKKFFSQNKKSGEEAPEPQASE